VHTPDPRRKHPPLGQKLYIWWWVPNQAMEEKPELLVDILFWNTTKKEMRFDLKERRIGYEVFELVGKEYETTGGILTYRARMIGSEGNLIEEWRHQMWTNLIEIKGRSTELPQLPLDEEAPEGCGEWGDGMVPTEAPFCDGDPGGEP